MTAMQLNTLHLTVLYDAHEDEMGEYGIGPDITASEAVAIAELCDLGLLMPIGDEHWVITLTGGQALVDEGWS